MPTYYCGSCYAREQETAFATIEECETHTDECKFVARDWDNGFVYGIVIEHAALYDKLTEND